MNTKGKKTVFGTLQDGASADLFGIPAEDPDISYNEVPKQIRVSDAQFLDRFV